MEGAITQARPNSFQCLTDGPFDTYPDDSFVSPEFLVASGMADPGRWPDVSQFNIRESEQLLVEIELGDRKRDAVKAQLVSQIHAGRHTVTRLVELTGTRRSDAIQLNRLSRVVQQVPEAGELLAAGQLSAAHVSALSVLSPESAAALLPDGLVQDADTFQKTVAEQHRHDTPDLPDRQRKARSLVFRVGNDQMITFKGTLEPVIGAEFKGLITHITNRNYYADNRIVSDTREQRNADALAELVTLATNNLAPAERVGSAKRRTILTEVNINVDLASDLDNELDDELDLDSENDRAESDPADLTGPAPVPLARRDRRRRAGPDRPHSTDKQARNKRPGKRPGQRARRRSGPKPVPARPAMVISVDAVTLAAEIVDGPTLTPTELIELVQRSEVYTMLTNGTEPVRLNYDRTRRVADHLQWLALAATQKQCVIPGCHQTADQCQVHHLIEFEDGGLTNIDVMVLLCSQHHQHLHRNDLQLTKNPDGTYTINRKPDPY
jgi:hypothetical protein